MKARDGLANATRADRGADAGPVPLLIALAEVTAVRFREIATRLRVVNKRVAVVAMIPTGGE